MPREINCYKCQAYLGEIKDAKLRKDILFICRKCSEIKIKRSMEDDASKEMLKTLFDIK